MSNYSADLHRTLAAEPGGVAVKFYAINKLLMDMDAAGILSLHTGDTEPSDTAKIWLHTVTPENSNGIPKIYSGGAWVLMTPTLFKAFLTDPAAINAAIGPALAAAIGVTLQAWDEQLDELAALDPERGSLIYEGAGGLAALAPGTAGHVLQTNGVGADPTWVAQSGGGGGATNLSYTASPANGVVTSDTGTDATLPLSDGTNAGLLAPAQHAKLAGVAAGATANSTDAALRDRATHTGTQTASTISDLAEAVDDRVAALLVQGSNVTLTYNDASNTLTIDAATGGGGGGYNLVVFTASGTYTPSSGITSIEVTVVGAGGGSGGCTGAASSFAVGAGGGGGGAAIKRILAAALGATEAVTVGAGGAAGTNAGGQGGSGGASSFGSHCTAGGGGGGVGMTAGTTAVASTGGQVGTASGGDLNLSGNPGSPGVRFSGTGGFSGSGGSSALGCGSAQGRATFQGAGLAGGNYGGGASGAMTNSATANAGGVGAPGIVIVREFF